MNLEYGAIIGAADLAGSDTEIKCLITVPDHITKCVNLHNDLVAMLRQLEWYGGRLNEFAHLVDSCPFCANTMMEGHGPNCALAALLKKCEE
jgi:hypothetical protein